MRPYEKRASTYVKPIAKHIHVSPDDVTQPQVRPGYTLCQLIDQFFESGVTPDFPPADLGVDDTSTEVDENGDPLVDPVSNIRIGRDLRRQMKLDARLGVSTAFNDMSPEEEE